VTELNARDGALVRVVTPAKSGLSYPFAIAYGDGRIWVTSGGNVDHNSAVIELSPSDGMVLRVLREHVYDPTDVLVLGPDVWIADQLNNSVTEFVARTGSFVRVLKSRAYHFNEPYGMAAVGNDLWVTNGEGRYPLTEIDASSGVTIPP
jgi:hypothetical protein